MLNGEKVIVMTKLALYEQNEGKKEIPISRYFRGDYISIHIIGSFFAFTIAFVIGFALWAACEIEYLINNITSMDIIGFGKSVILLYVLLLVLYLVCCYIYYSRKFKQIRVDLKYYNRDLKKLQKIQQDEIENTITDRQSLKEVIERAEEQKNNDGLT